jgi:DNA-binding response OmpR family regulator
MKPTILVVDDEYPIRKLLDFVLSKSYHVIMLENSYEAMNWLIKGNKPDILILDIEMPKFNGKDLLIEIKKDKNLENIPIIMLSGNEKTVERIECLNAGADDFMLKPFNPLELEVRINNIFKRANYQA